MSVNYSFKHNFNWPLPTASPLPNAVAAEAQAAHAAFAHAPRFAGGQAALPGMYGYPGYGGFRYRRFGLFRRFFWFGLGIGAASWWIGHKQRERERLAAIGEAPENKWHAWHRRWHDEYRPAQGPSVTAAPATLPVDHSSASAPAPAMPPVAATPTPAPVQHPIPPIAPEQVVPKEDRRWGWRGRQHSPSSTAPASSQPVTASTTPIPFPTSPSAAAPPSMAQDEMAQIKEAVEKLWADKKRDVAEAQERARVEAREYAREKLDKLSAALETLRESLKQDADKKDRKLV